MGQVRGTGHFSTYDGYDYTFFGNGEFTLVAVEVTAGGAAVLDASVRISLDDEFVENK